MKKLLSIFLLSVTILVFGQHKFNDIPKFNEADLSKTKSTIKEDAPAEILYKSVQNELYTDGTMDFKVFSRIKIYDKDKAADYLNIEVPLYEGQKDRENISGIKAITYNLEDGKVTKTTVDRDSRYRSKEDKKITMVKFAFENVKNGSVIEYQYTITSPFLFELRKIFFEFDIPAVYHEYILDAPAYLGYNINYQGSLMPKYKDVTTKILFGESYNTWRLGFENVKPFKEEKFQRNADNFKTSIRPEVNSTNINNVYKNYSTSWNEVREKLKEYESFGYELKKQNAVKNLLPSEIANTSSALEKANKILKYVQSNYNWDESFGIFTDKGIRNLINTKTGNVAEINFLLIMLMREAGLNANPIILKTVKNGLLNVAFPTIADPNYVIAGLEINNQIYALDATSKLSEINLLPPRDYNYNGVLITDKEAKILDINNSILSQTFLTVEAKMNEDASFLGNFKDRDTKMFALLSNSHYNEGNENYKKEYKDRYPFAFTDLKSGLLDNKDFETSFNFDSDGFVDSVGNKMIFNPLLFLYRQNHDFNQTEERKYPIEFDSPYEKVKKVTITIPDNFEFETIPSSKKFRTEDDGIIYSYIVTKEGKKITIETSIKVDGTDFPKEYYPAFKQIFDNITKLEGQLVTVVKK